MPKHIAISVSGHKDWAEENKESIENVYKYVFENVKEIIELQIKYNTPLVTLYLLTNKVSKSEYFSEIIDKLVEFFDLLVHNNSIHENKIKVSILGKWYNLPGRVIDSIKRVIDETKDYDHYFLNLCINYDGKEELVDSCKLIARRVVNGKLDVDSIDEDAIKENLYSSYFLPPDLIIKTGYNRKIGGFLLWDSTSALIHFTDIPWIDYDEEEFIKSLKYYQDYK
ncbi:di-trans,poly-cis-decaprenylcistransferase [Candidatus Woesearchaeota archaeon]|nr:di-trans,poly-cis-decaprenylcistransferase [Candidatus Woesearchaeota archaeon]